MAENYFDEGVFLRLAQLKQGKIRFTDATNAMRLWQEHGAGCRVFLSCLLDGVL